MLHHPFTNWIYIFQLINRISTPTEIYISMKSFHMTLKPKRTKNRSTIFTFNLSLITFLAYGFSYIKTFYMFKNLTFITNSTSSINYVVCVIVMGLGLRLSLGLELRLALGPELKLRVRLELGLMLGLEMGLGLQLLLIISPSLELELESFLFFSQLVPLLIPVQVSTPIKGQTILTQVPLIDLTSHAHLSILSL